MGNPITYTTNYVRVRDSLTARSKSLRTAAAKRQAIERAASGRPADLAKIAREAVNARRVQRDLDMIAGTV